MLYSGIISIAEIFGQPSLSESVPFDPKFAVIWFTGFNGLDEWVINVIFHITILSKMAKNLKVII